MIIRCNLMIDTLLYYFWFPLESTPAAYEMRYAVESVGKLVVATNGWKIVGCLRYREQNDSLYVSHFGSRQKGIGTALLNDVKKHGKTITLFCESHNLEFYNKQGFAIESKQFDGYNMIYIPVV